MRKQIFTEGQAYKALSSFKSKGFAPTDDDYDFVAGESYTFVKVRYNHYDGILYVEFRNVKNSEKLIWYWDDHDPDELCYELFDIPS